MRRLALGLLTVVLTLVLATIGVYAQEPVWEDNFEDGDVSDWFTERPDNELIVVDSPLPGSEKAVQFKTPTAQSSKFIVVGVPVELTVHADDTISFAYKFETTGNAQYLAIGVTAEDNVYYRAIISYPPTDSWEPVTVRVGDFYDHKRNLIPDGTKIKNIKIIGRIDDPTEDVWMKVTVDDLKYESYQ